MLLPRRQMSTLFPYTTLFRSIAYVIYQNNITVCHFAYHHHACYFVGTFSMLVANHHICIKIACNFPYAIGDRKSTRLNSSHVEISYDVFCLEKKKMRQMVSKG